MNNEKASTTQSPPAQASAPTPEYEHSADGKTIMFKNAAECLRAAQASDEPMRELPESWRTSDISWICSYLKEHTIFDVDRLQREWNEMKALAIQAATPRATADVERDAARYRWLREMMAFDQAFDAPVLMQFGPMVTKEHDMHTDWHGENFDSSVDRTIDAAIAATKQKADDA